MPIYEYRCLACKRRTSVFVRSVSAPVSAACEHCGSARMERLLSRFAVHRGRIDFDNPDSFADLDESDPKTMARLARQMRDETGEDLGPEFDEMVGRIEAGEDPESVMGEGGEEDLSPEFDD
jgi:putative FmdB family regulatory protein